MIYTVIGLWLNDEPVVAGVIEGEHNCVDTGDGDRWATPVEADDPDKAEVAAVLEMEGGDEDDDD